MNHAELCESACKWLKRIGCRAIISEMSSAAQEEPDAIGWKNGISILVECKTSLSDFRRDQYKFWRRSPKYGMGDWRFYMCEPEVIKKEHITNDWGLVYVEGKRFKKIICPKGNVWGKPPYKSNNGSEIKLLVSALSRFQKLKENEGWTQ